MVAKNPLASQLFCAHFQKGHPKDLYLAITRKCAQEGMYGRTTMSSPETSADGSDVGAGVGTYYVFNWERVVASFIANSSAALAPTYFFLIHDGVCASSVGCHPPFIVCYCWNVNLSPSSLIGKMAQKSYGLLGKN